MNRLLAIPLFFLLLFAGFLCLQQSPPASAQCTIALCGAGKGAPGGAAYQGPGDVVSGASAWGGLRAYNAAYALAGSKAANICDVSTGLVCSDVNVLANGDFDRTTAAALTQCSVSCNIAILYDQSGNGKDFSQATNSARPLLVFNCLNTNLPCMAFTIAASKTLKATLAGTIAVPWSVSAVGNRTGSTTTFSGLIGSSTGSNLGLEYTNSTNTIWMNGLTLAASDNAFHAIQGTLVNATPTQQIYVDDATNSGTAGGSAAMTTAIQIGAVGVGGFLDGRVTEGGFWAGNINNSLCHNERAYWGISASC